MKAISRGVRFTTILFISVGMMLFSPGAQNFVIAQTRPDPYQAARTKLDEFMTVLEDLSSQLDRTQFDLQALSFDLAFEDPDTIVAWVRENIAFEPYLGLLRGGRGTLMSRAGNALDQAVLLATLLNDAGYEANIARGRLSAAQVEHLFRQVATVPLQPSAFRDPEEVVQIMSRLDREAIRTDQTQDAMLDALFDSLAGEVPDDIPEQTEIPVVESELAPILDALEWKEASSPVEVTMESIRGELEDYYWVRFRTDGTEAWRDAHPSFAEPSDDPAVDITEEFTGEVPEELSHRFFFRVVIARAFGDRIDEIDVVPTWERPVANLVGTTMTYANLPDGLDESGDLEEVRDNLLESRFFVPVFQSSFAPDSLFFDLQGNVVPPDAASSPYAALFQEISRGFNNAATALSGFNSPSVDEQAQRLLGQWVEYGFRTPDGSVTTYRKEILDLVGYGSIDDGVDLSDEEIRWALTSTHTFAVAAGEHPAAYVLDQMITSVLNMRGSFEKVLELAYSPSLELLEETIEAYSEETPGWVGHARLYNAFDIGPSLRNAIIYRPAPTLAVLATQPNADLDILQSIDILQNPRRAFSTDPDRPTYLAEEVVRAGIWESYLETAAVNGEVREEGAFVDLQQRVKEGAPLQRIKTAEDVDQLDIAAEAKHHMITDLERGFEVLLPLVDGDELREADRIAWWRVDPRSGTTLARSGDGTGEGTAYVTILLVIAGGLVLYLGAMRMMKCWKLELGTACYVCAGFGMIFGALAIGIAVVGSTVVFASFVWAGAEAASLISMILGVMADIGCELHAVFSD